MIRRVTAADRARPARTILHLLSLTRGNGTAYMAARLCRLQAAAGERVLVGSRPGAKVREWTAGSGVVHLEGLTLLHGLHPLAIARDVARLRRVLRRERVDVVHAWQSAETWIAAWACVGTSARLAVMRAIDKPVRRTLARVWLHRRLAALFVTCRRIEETVLAAGAPRAIVFRLTDGVDQERFRPRPERAALRERLGLAPGQVVVANVGRLERVKGQAVLLRALARAPQEVVALVAGAGSLAGELEREARALGVAQRVRFLGQRSDVEELLAASDLFVLASLGSEGSSRATLEAMASGVCVVASDVGMLPDLVQHGETGVLVPPGDADALAAALTGLARDGGRRARLADAGLALVRRRHGEREMLESVQSVYERVLPPVGASGAGPRAGVALSEAVAR